MIQDFSSMKLPQDWKLVSIREVVDSLDSLRVPIESSIRTSKQGAFPYYGASGIIDYIDECIFDEELLLVAEDGANLLSRSTPIAFLASGKYWVNNHAHVLRPKENIDINYLRLTLDTLDLSPYVTGSAQPKLNAANLHEIKIPLPPLPEQKRIASLLRRADRLRQLRRTAHDLGDSLLQSVFLEMFGDPQYNDKNWELVKLGDKITFMTSGSRGWAEHYSDEGDLFLRIQNVGANRLLLDDVAYVHAPDNSESKRTKVQPGDLLISATADLGRTAVIPENFPTAYINQHLFLLRLKDLNPVFVAGYYSTTAGKAQILRLDR